MKIQAIYKIESLKTGLFYIGATSNYNLRKYSHIYQLKTNTHINKKLQFHFNKYGNRDLFFEIIEIVEKGEDIFLREKSHTSSLKPYFNIDGRWNSKASDVTKQRQREKRKGFTLSAEAKYKISKNSTDSKIVLNTETGIYYESIQEVANIIKKDRATVSRMLSDTVKNNTSFILADNKEDLRNPFNNERHQTGFTLLFNVLTGIHYYGFIEAANSVGINEQSFKKWVDTQKVPFIYA